jgi:chromosome segregation ATPase
VNWAAITPEGGPREVEQARARLDELRGRIGTERDRIEQSKRDLQNAEESDRARMASEFAAGNEPTSEVRGIEKLRAAVGEAERRAVALDTAIAAADQELGQAVERNRDRWAADCETAIEKHRQQARNALAELTDALNATSTAAATAAWLRPEDGEDQRRPPKTGFGSARSSARCGGGVPLRAQPSTSSRDGAG